MTKITYIPGEIANAAIDEHGNRKPVTRTQHIFDDAKGKSQAEVNKDIDDTLALHQSEINALDSQNYVTVDTFGELPATGAADTVYRVANYDGTQVVTNKYAEYAWNGTQYKLLDVKEYGVDDEPTAGSDNLVKSGGVSKNISPILKLDTIELGSSFTGKRYNGNLELVDVDYGIYYEPIDISNYIYHDIVVLLNNITTQSTRCIGIKSQDNEALFVKEEYAIESHDGYSYVRFNNIPSNSKYLCISHAVNNEVIKCVSIDVDKDCRESVLTNKNSINVLVKSVLGQSISGNASGVGTKYYDFTFEVGDEVILKNFGGGINAFTSDGTNDVEVIKRNIDTNEIITFYPSISANKLRIYFTESSGGSFTIHTYSLEDRVNGYNNAINVEESTGKQYDYKTVGSTITNESDILIDGSGYYSAVDLSAYAGSMIRISIKGTYLTSGRATLLVSNNIVVKSFRESELINKDTYVSVPENAVLYESHRTDSVFYLYDSTFGLIKKVEDIEEKILGLTQCYVSSDGDDSNDGTSDFPFKTITHAISSGYKNICVKSGEYNENVSFSNIDNLNIYADNNDTYVNTERTRPEFINGESYSEFTDGSSYKYFTPNSVPDSYTDVFVNLTKQPIITYEGFSNTYNVGLWAKCSNFQNDFMFKPVLTLAELSEENTFFYDGTNIYFNTSTNIESVVVVNDFKYNFEFTNCNNIRISGFKFLYSQLDNIVIHKSNNVIFENCVAAYSLKRNGFSHSYSDSRFINCVAFKNRRDGFNAAYYGVANFENCNSIYNYDDGESSHEYCEVNVIGGEYAYNGKAGHAPVNGCKFTCNGTYSHNNTMYGLLNGSIDDYNVSSFLVSNSVFINNGSYDIMTSIDINIINTKYTTKTGSGNIINLTE